MFGPLGLNCKELTGDTEIDDFFEIQDSHIILTTPVCTALYLDSTELRCEENKANEELKCFLCLHLFRKSGTV